MVLVTFLAVYPLSLVFQWLVVPWTQQLNILVRGMVFPLVVVPVLTYLLMVAEPDDARLAVPGPPDAPARTAHGPPRLRHRAARTGRPMNGQDSAPSPAGVTASCAGPTTWW